MDPRGLQGRFPSFPFQHSEPMPTAASEDEQSGGSSCPGQGMKKDSSKGSRRAMAQGGGTGGGGSGGEGGEVVRKPRGRPPGSKNKPKPPIIITRDTGAGMRPHVLEVATGCDICESIATFARRRQRGLCVLSGRGTVSNVSLRQTAASGATVTFHGRFDILSLSGAFLLQPAPLTAAGLTVSLAGAQGQVLGGNVVGALTAASPVLVIAASFVGQSYDRLPLEDDEQVHHGASSMAQNQVAPPELCNTTLFNIPHNALPNCQLPPDVLAWATGVRPPPF